VSGDIDVLVIGNVDVEDVRRRANAAGEELARDVTVTALSSGGWANPSVGFARLQGFKSPLGHRSAGL